MIYKDLSYGVDRRGDYALFIDIRHFLDDGWTVDDEAGEMTTEPTFFRVIIDGEHDRRHGWIEGRKVVQWG